MIMKKIVTLFALLFTLITINVAAQNNTLNNEIKQHQVIGEPNLIFRYYYYPNLMAYYDNQTSEYLYKLNGIWIRNKSIPNAYGGYSIYNNYKVEIDNYSGDNPNEKITEHKKLFPYFRNDRQGKLAQLKAKQLEENKTIPAIVYNED